MKCFALIVGRFFIGLFVIASAASPALAAPLGKVVTVSLQALAPQYSGPCPATIKFSGEIDGLAGLQVQYQFIHVFGKIKTPESFVAATIPKSGKLAVSDALTIPQSQAGAQSDELQIYPTGTPKAAAAFTVTCLTPTPKPSSSPTPPPKPTPTPSPKPSGINLRNLRPGVLTLQPTPTPLLTRRNVGTIVNATLLAPTGLTNTTDLNVCKSHVDSSNPFIGLICGTAIQQQLLILVWNWSPLCSSCPQADGYKVYRVDHGRHDYLGSQTPTSTTEFGPALPSDGFSGKCYAVTAYNSKQESVDSQAWCLNGTLSSGTTIVTLQPRYTGEINTLTTHRSGICNQTNSAVQGQMVNGNGGLFSIGWQYYEDEGTLCNWHYSWYTRGVALFDLSSLAGHPLWKATLNLGSYYTNWYGKVLNGQPRPAAFSATNRYSCIDHLDTASSDWWDNINSWPASSPYFDWPVNTLPNGIDVTQQVRSWLQAAPDFGFVFRPDQEGDRNDETAQYGCWSTIESVSLTVEYFP